MFGRRSIGWRLAKSIRVRRTLQSSLILGRKVVRSPASLVVSNAVVR